MEATVDDHVDAETMLLAKGAKVDDADAKQR